MGLSVSRHWSWAGGFKGALQPFPVCPEKCAAVFACLPRNTHRGCCNAFSRNKKGKGCNSLLKLGILREITLLRRRFGGTAVPPNGIVHGDMRAGDGAMIPKENPIYPEESSFPCKNSSCPGARRIFFRGWYGRGRNSPARAVQQRHFMDRKQDRKTFSRQAGKPEHLC